MDQRAQHLESRRRVPTLFLDPATFPIHRLIWRSRYYDVALGWSFPWYGETEDAISIGTNGMITFGDAHLRNGGSEPIPCVSENMCDGNNYGSHVRAQSYCRLPAQYVAVG